MTGEVKRQELSPPITKGVGSGPKETADSVYLVIDESQDRKHFVLAGVLLRDQSTAADIVGDMRTAARRAKVFLKEFHETELHRYQPRLLTRHLEMLSFAPRRPKRRPAPREGVKLLGAYYAKVPREGESLTRDRLRMVYAALFQAIVSALPEESQAIEVACDHFTGDFSVRPQLEVIVQRRFKGSLEFAESSQVKGLQLADLVAGTVRRYLAEEDNGGRFQILAPILHYLQPVRVTQP